VKKNFVKTWWTLIVLFAFMLAGPIGTLVYRTWFFGYVPREIAIFMALVLALQIWCVIRFIKSKAKKSSCL